MSRRLFAGRQIDCQATSTDSIYVPDQVKQLQHHAPENVRDRIAYLFVKFLRIFADSFFPGAMAIVRLFWKPSLQCRAWSVVLCST